MVKEVENKEKSTHLNFASKKGEPPLLKLGCSDIYIVYCTLGQSVSLEGPHQN